MEAGRLRNKIVIEQAASRSNEYGEPVKTWTPFAEAWADITPIAAREIAFARGYAETVTHKLVIRYAAGVTADMRVNFGGVILSINGVIDPDLRRRELNLYCTQVQ